MDRLVEWMALKASSDTSRRGFLGLVGSAGLAMATMLLGSQSAFAKKKAAKKKTAKKKARRHHCCEYECERPDGQLVTVRTCRHGRPCAPELESLGQCSQCTLQTETTVDNCGGQNCERSLNGCVARKKAAKKKKAKKKATKKKTAKKKKAKKKAAKKK